MRYTLLELVQDVLSSMDSDEVNNINDTVESQQVVSIIKTVYDDILSRGDLAKQKVPFNLVASTNPLKPTLMTKPSNIERIDWIKYNKVLDGDVDPVWAEIRYIELDSFFSMMHGLLPSETDVDTFDHTVDGFTFTFTYKNDLGPTYYTTFDDNTVVFDSYDIAVDDTLQTSKTLCFGSKSTLFQESNIFIPDLQPHQFALLLNEAKSLAWAELKQMPHQKAERTARRNWIHLSKTRQSIPSGRLPLTGNNHAFDHLPNYSKR